MQQQQKDLGRRRLLQFVKLVEQTYKKKVVICIVRFLEQEINHTNVLLGRLGKKSISTPTKKRKKKFILSFFFFGSSGAGRD